MSTGETSVAGLLPPSRGMDSGNPDQTLSRSCNQPQRSSKMWQGCYGDQNNITVESCIVILWCEGSKAAVCTDQVRHSSLLVG